MVGGSLYAAFLSSGHTTRADGLTSGFDGQAHTGQALQAQQSLLSSAPIQQGFVSPAAPAAGQQSRGSPAASAPAQSNASAGSATSDTTQSAGLAAPSEGEVRISAAQTTPQSSGQANPSAGATPPPGSAPGPSASPIASATARATSTPACDTTVSALYCVYAVQPGDTLSSIAQRFGLKGNDDVTSWEILAASNKPDVVDEDDLSIGQKLRIPTQSGVLHTVLSAQTLTDIAEQYDVSTKDILAVAVNQIGNADSLAIGQEVLVPAPKRFAAPAPPPPTPAPAPSAAAAASRSSSGSGSGSTPATSNTAGGPRSAAGFIWPASGPISSYFGAGHPLGIDIDFFSNPNQPVGAAAGGTVTFAGGNACCSYGLYVVVDHGNGLQTLYAHLSKISVSVGQKVSQGQTLGLGGRTGYATGNHLHFEVHVNGAVVNPLSYLP